MTGSLGYTPQVTIRALGPCPAPDGAADVTGGSADCLRASDTLSIATTPNQHPVNTMFRAANEGTASARRSPPNTIPA